MVLYPIIYSFQLTPRIFQKVHAPPIKWYTMLPIYDIMVLREPGGGNK